MLKVTLLNFKLNNRSEEFECITYEVEKGYYKFYISTTMIRYVPSYDFIIDIVYPFELKIDEQRSNSSGAD